MHDFIVFYISEYWALLLILAISFFALRGALDSPYLERNYIDKFSLAIDDGSDRDELYCILMALKSESPASKKGYLSALEIKIDMRKRNEE